MGLFNRKEFFMRSIDVNNHGQFSFANLAFELLKIIVLSATNNFFFDLEVNPLSQAI